MQRNSVFITAGAIFIAILSLIALSRRPTDIFTKSLERRRQRFQSAPSTTRPYEAPTHLCDSETRAPNKYVVFLHSNYSLKEHKQAVRDRLDLDSAIKFIFPETERHGLHYSTELSVDSLAAVRADIGVDMVECDLRPYLIEMPPEDAGEDYQDGL